MAVAQDSGTVPIAGNVFNREVWVGSYRFTSQAQVDCLITALQQAAAVAFKEYVTEDGMPRDVH